VWSTTSISACSAGGYLRKTPGYADDGLNSRPSEYKAQQLVLNFHCDINFSAVQYCEFKVTCNESGLSSSLSSCALPWFCCRHLSASRCSTVLQPIARKQRLFQCLKRHLDLNDFSRVFFYSRS